jgi:hypothetical protein
MENYFFSGDPGNLNSNNMCVLQSNMHWSFQWDVT